MSRLSEAGADGASSVSNHSSTSSSVIAPWVSVSFSLSSIAFLAPQDSCSVIVLESEVNCPWEPMTGTAGPGFWHRFGLALVITLGNDRLLLSANVLPPPIHFDATSAKRGIEAPVEVSPGSHR